MTILLISEYCSNRIFYKCHFIVAVSVHFLNFAESESTFVTLKILNELILGTAIMNDMIY